MLTRRRAARHAGRGGAVLFALRAMRYLRPVTTTSWARARALLWLDGGAGFVVGVVVLAFLPWVARLHGLSEPIVRFFGVANLVYASYSGTLAVRASRGAMPSRLALGTLIVGNLAWTCVCAAILATNGAEATGFGRAYVALEGVFVAVLAFAEKRFVWPLAGVARTER